MVTRRRTRRWVCWVAVGVGGAAALLWVLSFIVRIDWMSAADSVTLARGAIRSEWRTQPGRTPGIQVTWFQSPSMTPWVPYYSRQFSQATIPLWIPIVIGLFAAYRLLPETGRAGTCPNCAFDLRGAPRVEVRKEHVRCTECGTVCERDVLPEADKNPEG